MYVSILPDIIYAVPPRPFLKRDKVYTIRASRRQGIVNAALLFSNLTSHWHSPTLASGTRLIAIWNDEMTRNMDNISNVNVKQ